MDWVLVLLLVLVVVGFFWGGVFFQRLMVAICPRANNILWHRRFMASEPSGSSKENKMEDTEPGEYMAGARTHEGFCVMLRVV